MNPHHLEKLEARPTQAGLVGEPIETIQHAIQALSDPDAHIWQTILQLKSFTSRLETRQDFDQLTPAQQIDHIVKRCEQYDLLGEELQQLICKLAARWVSRAVHSGQLALDQLELEPPPDCFGPYDPEAEPWLAAMISRCFVE